MRTTTRIMIAAAAALALFALAPAGASAARVTHDGNGYNVFVCRAAQQQGYAPPLNQAFGSNSTAPGRLETSNSCDNWSRGVPGHLAAFRVPGSASLATTPAAPHRSMWAASVDGNQGLRIRRAEFNYDVSSCWEECGFPNDQAGENNGISIYPFATRREPDVVTCRSYAHHWIPSLAEDAEAFVRHAPPRLSADRIRRPPPQCGARGPARGAPRRLRIG